MGSSRNVVVSNGKCVLERFLVVYGVALPCKSRRKRIVIIMCGEPYKMCVYLLLVGNMFSGLLVMVESAKIIILSVEERYYH